MKPKSTDKSVSGMDVLKDIRGLLSVNQEAAKEPPKVDKNEAKAETTRLEEQVRHFQELARKQQDELNRLETQKKELTARINELSSVKSKPVVPASGNVKDDIEIQGLEARKESLSAELTQIEDLLRLRLQDLMKRIARIFAEGGQDEVALEFRRSASQLEVAENFARFLQVLLKE